ncbi:MAG: DegT/DnrJ/EryC1/StrS family aminotransferase [Phycisphaeraceae bacterium]|nr:DegT/DnrJ/EryC1/StrS family aminotransferase [Phycisphaeraceae bacterium]
MSPKETPDEATSVPLLDLCEQYRTVEKEVLERFEEILAGQQMINGPAVGELECAIAGYCDCEFAVGVSSGTDALLAALMALEIGSGDEVITTPFTFFATAGSVWRTGARPVFVDIDPATFNIDPNQIEAAITRNTRAIMPVHLFGQCADMDPILEIAGRHDLAVIEDAAQAIGARYRGKPAGSMGTAGCFSFFPTKNLGGAGDGGMVVTRDTDLDVRLRSLRNHGATQRYYHETVGGNFRLDTLQAAYLSVKLKYLDSWHEARRANAALYDRRLAGIGEVTTPVIADDCESVYNQYVIRTEQRDDLRAHLEEHHVGSAIYYPLCLHEQACFRELGYARGDFPVAERAASEVLALPIYPELKQDQIEYVASTIQAYFRS